MVDDDDEGVLLALADDDFDAAVGAERQARAGARRLENPGERVIGRRVPEDVAVGGFDDSPVAVTTSPPLTTIRQPWQRISSEMARLLLGLIEGDPPSAVILRTKLIRRGSA